VVLAAASMPVDIAGGVVVGRRALLAATASAAEAVSAVVGIDNDVMAAWMCSGIDAQRASHRWH